MNFNTENDTFRQLLGNGLRYRVPPFQRDYSWTENEWDDLWLDIMGLFEDDGESAHYMGYLVLQSEDNKQFEIIDGQQRITTISILILAALGHLQDLVDSGFDSQNNAKRKNHLQNSYIGYVDPVTLVAKSKLELNRHNNKFYQTYLVPLEKLPQRRINASEHMLRKAFIWFKDKLRLFVGETEQSGVALAKFVDGLVDKLFFTVITVSDELNAFKVFETLNARGVRLSSTDLLKNYLFAVISTEQTHEGEMESLELRWERIVDLLSNESFPEFLRVFWNSRHKLVRKSDLFKVIRNNIHNRQEAFQLLRELDGGAAVYAGLRDPGDKAWLDDEKNALEQLLMFGVKQPLAILMAAHEQFYETDRASFSQILKAIAVVSFRYNVICNLQPQDQERLYNSIARKISNGDFTNGHAVLEALREVYPKDEPFKAAFATKEFRTTNSRNKKVVKYILFEINRRSAQTSLDPESADYNLEHVLPENPAESWSYINENQQDRLIYRIGNMTLLELKVNRELGNSDFETKVQAYQKSDFKLTRAIAENYEQWNEQKIDARQKQLAKLAATIWRY